MELSRDTSLAVSLYVYQFISYLYLYYIIYEWNTLIYIEILSHLITCTFLLVTVNMTCNILYARLFESMCVRVGVTSLETTKLQESSVCLLFFAIKRPSATGAGFYIYW